MQPQVPQAHAELERLPSVRNLTRCAVITSNLSKSRKSPATAALLVCLPWSGIRRELEADLELAGGWRAGGGADHVERRVQLEARRLEDDTHRHARNPQYLALCTVTIGAGNAYDKHKVVARPVIVTTLKVSQKAPGSTEKQSRMSRM